MKYDVVLQGNKNIIIDEQEKQMLVQVEKNKTSTVEIRGNRFKVNIIKGIFPVKEEVSDNKEAWMQSNKDWHFMCLGMSKRSPEDKTVVEIDNRILNGTRLEKIEIPEQEMAVMYSQILDFFQKNPIYPRCPMRIWWPFLRDKLKSKNLFVSRWWVYVARNDEAIDEWVKYNS